MQIPLIRPSVRRRSTDGRTEYLSVATFRLDHIIVDHITLVLKSFKAPWNEFPFKILSYTLTTMWLLLENTSNIPYPNNAMVIMKCQNINRISTTNIWSDTDGELVVPPTEFIQKIYRPLLNWLSEQIWNYQFNIDLIWTD